MKPRPTTIWLLLAILLFGVSGTAQTLHEIVDHSQYAPRHAHATGEQDSSPDHPLPSRQDDHQDCLTCHNLAHAKSSTLHLSLTGIALSPTDHDLVYTDEVVRSVPAYRLPQKRGPPAIHL